MLTAAAFEAAPSIINQNKVHIIAGAEKPAGHRPAAAAFLHTVVAFEVVAHIANSTSTLNYLL